MDPTRQPGLLRIEDYCSYRDEPIWIVGEEGDRWKIQTEHRIDLNGYGHYFDPGQTLIIEKSRVIGTL